MSNENMSYNKKSTEFDFDGLRFGLKSSDQTVTSRIQHTMLESFKNTVSCVFYDQSVKIDISKIYYYFLDIKAMKYLRFAIQSV